MGENTHIPTSGAKRRPRDSENIRTIVNIHDYIYNLELCIYTIYDDAFHKSRDEATIRGLFDWRRQEEMTK